MCWSSSRTNSEIISSPSIKSVSTISTILPSIITDVSSTFGLAGFLLLSSLKVDFKSLFSLLVLNKLTKSSLFLAATLQPKKPKPIYNKIDNSTKIELPT